jgi:hypothetical protein
MPRRRRVAGAGSADTGIDNPRMQFEASIEQHGAGNVLEIPFDVKATWGKARAPVVATINGHTFRSTVAVYGGRYLLGLNRDVREAAGVQAGDRVVVDLELDTAERTVTPPPELEAALAREPELRGFFDSLSFTHRKEYVRWIEEAKRQPTREARIEKAIAMLRDRVKTPG